FNGFRRRGYSDFGQDPFDDIFEIFSAGRRNNWRERESYQHNGDSNQEMPDVVNELHLDQEVLKKGATLSIEIEFPELFEDKIRPNCRMEQTVTQRGNRYVVMQKRVCGDGFAKYRRMQREVIDLKIPAKSKDGSKIVIESKDKKIRGNLH
ncbi:MAG: hypothetical protein MHPSP_000804, partial [Paramarteilia canceri]